ncbi:MAG: DUF4424 domain-containing protein [candidate division Zixibacteria bacterium]|nr:DUF4424 domain-containing protein [candidate division Zixibacteria bacterium]
MKMKLIYFWIILFSLLSLSTTRADDAEFAGEGETVWPIENKEIEMVAETVMVRPAGRRWEVTCTFILRNTGEATEIQVGFPDLTDEGPGADTSRGTIQDFKCYVDGKEVNTQHKTGIESPRKTVPYYPLAYVWKVPFKKGQKRIVKNTYNFGGLYISDGTTELNYILTTGALWKGTIESALIVFDLGKLDPRFTYSIRPTGYKIKDHQISWNFKDFEPETDIEIGLSPLVQEWFEEAEIYNRTDSIEVLKSLLYNGDWLLERHIPRNVENEFFQKYENLIARLESLGVNASRFRALKAIRTEDAQTDVRESFNFIEELKKKDELSDDDEEILYIFSYQAHCCLDNLEIRKGLSEVFLIKYEREISCLDTIQDPNKRSKTGSYLMNQQAYYKKEIENLDSLINQQKGK